MVMVMVMVIGVRWMLMDRDSVPTCPWLTNQIQLNLQLPSKTRISQPFITQVDRIYIYIYFTIVFINKYPYFKGLDLIFNNSNLLFNWYYYLTLPSKHT